MSSTSESLNTALQSVLIPNLIIFLVGWLMGATHIFTPPAVYVLNMTLLYFIFPCAVFSGFLNYRLVGRDFLFIVPNILIKFLVFVPAFVPFFIKKIDLRMACNLWLTGVYCDAISYGNYYFNAFYSDPAVGTCNSLATVPTNIIFFPIIVYILEYQDYKKQMAESPVGKPAQSTLKMFLNICLRVIKNPLVWASFFGIILNQAVLGPGGKFPVWFIRFFVLGAQCTMPMNLFLLGVFTATYDPIHKNVMRFLCCIVSPIKNICCASSDSEVAATAAAEPPSAPTAPTWSKKPETNSQPSLSLSLSSRQAEEGGKQGTDSEMEIEPKVEAGDAREMEIESKGEAGDVQHTTSVKEQPQTATAQAATATAAPTAEAPGAAAGTPAAAAAGTPAAAAPPPPYKFNFLLLLTQIIIRHVICSFLMIVLNLIFGSSLNRIQQHMLVLIQAFGTGGPVFILGRQYNAYPGEAAVTQILGVILNMPVIIGFYFLTETIFPME